MYTFGLLQLSDRVGWKQLPGVEGCWDVAREMIHTGREFLAIIEDPGSVLSTQLVPHNCYSVPDLACSSDLVGHQKHMYVLPYMQVKDSYT